MKDRVCFSVISHGHGSMLNRLLGQMNIQPTMVGARVVVTLNLWEESFDAGQFSALDLCVIRNADPKGFGANHNAAFKYCETAWFCVLNPDLELTDREPFSDMLARHEKAGSVNALPVGVIAPCVMSSQRIPEDSVRSNLTPWSLVRRTIGLREHLHCSGDARLGCAFFWVAGMCLLARADAYRAIRGFDERFYLYCEDYDFCARLYNAGWAIHVDDKAQIIHDAQRDSHRNIRHLLMHLSSLAKVWLSKAFWRITICGLTQNRFRIPKIPWR